MTATFCKPVYFKERIANMKKNPQVKQEMSKLPKVTDFDLELD